MRYLILIHRYLGTAVGILMVGWCVTGIVMMYVRYPELAQATRLLRLQPLDRHGCCVVANAALPDGAGVEGFQVESLGDSPALHVQFTDGRQRLIDLTDGQPIAAVSPLLATIIASQYRARDDAAAHSRSACTPARLLDRISYDEWTVSGEFNSARPLYRFALDDRSGTQLYVSARTGRVVQVTTASLRFWNWVGAVPHWLYFAQLRRHPALWNQVVIWTSLAGCFLALLGIYIGIRQFLHRPAGRWSSYRGVLYWHHLPGLIFGLFALTWVASGLISINPWGFLDSSGTSSTVSKVLGPAVSGAEVKQSLNALASSLASQDLVSLASTRLWGQLYLVETHSDGTRGRINPSGSAAPLMTSDWRRIAQTLAGTADANAERMTSGDKYYNSRPGVPAQFPIYRVVLDHQPRTRYYLDPITGTPLEVIDTDARWYRWLHRGLHTMDFSAALRTRPVWDIVMLLLLVGVSAVGGTGTWLAWRRYIRIRH